MTVKSQIISLSGGKDSTAMLLMMIERKEPIEAVVFFDTGWEFPQTYDHLDLLEKRTGLKITRLKPRHPFDELIVKYSWPWMQGRWCSREKMDALNKFSHENGNGVQIIGFAVNEKSRTGAKEFKKKRVRFPLIEWGISENDTLSYCYQKGYFWDGLYKHFSRVSCFSCPLKGSPKAWRLIRKYYPEQWQKMLQMDKSILNNRGFYGYKTVHDLEKRFADEDKQNNISVKSINIFKPETMGG